MRRLVTLALVPLLALTACSTAEGEPESKALPDLTLSGFDGAPDVDLGDLRGPAVINFWASWCGPCVKEMPLIQEFHASYGDEVAVLGIDFQDFQPDKARALVRESGVTYPLVTDQAGETNGEGGFPPLRALPYLAFVDADGTVAHVEATVIDSSAELVEMVDEHLGVQL